MVERKLLLRLRTGGDALDFQPRQFAAVTDRAVIAFPATVFERDDFLVFALFNDFGRDLSAITEFSAVDVHQHFEGGCFAGLDVEKIDVHRVAFRDAILPATSLDDCVGHKVIFRGEKAAQNLIEGFAWQAKGGSRSPSAINALGTTRSDQEHDFAFGRMCFVVSKQFGGGTATEFFEFLG